MSADAEDGDEAGFEPLFNGRDLTGWTTIPRVYTELWKDGPTVGEALDDRPPEQRFSPRFLAESHHRAAHWTVESGVIVGRQDQPGGFGGFLITDRDFANFELRLEARPDWPADTGILVRKLPETWRGIQILLDHRRSGSIGGFYGNGIGGFHAVSFAVDAELAEDGSVVRLVPDDEARSIEPVGDKARLLTYGATLDEFLAAWRPGDWNEFRVRVEGRLPRITTWINGVKIAAIDLETLDAPHYDAEWAAEKLGRSGRIALEVHDTDPMLGAARWGAGAACRWRNIRVRTIGETA